MPDNATIYAPIHLFPTQRHLTPIAGGAAIEIDEDQQRALLKWPALSIRLTRMPDDAMGEHLSGFRGYILQRGGGIGLATRAASTLSVYGLVVEPGFDDQGEAMRFVARLTGATDGLCFLGGDIIDARGRSLLAHDDRPEAGRVARRALVLLAVSFRCLLDDDAGTDDEAEAESLRAELAAWLRSTAGLEDEAEPRELALLDAPIGTVPKQVLVDGVWLAEGAQVLLWSLGARELPAHDAQEHPYDVAKAVGVMGDAAPVVLSSPALCDDDALTDRWRQLLGLHWRMTEQRVSPGPCDFRSFAADAWFGTMDLDGIALEGDDLSLRGAAVADAPPELQSLVSSIAMERHRAINWLLGAHPVYSRVVTPT